MGTLRQQFATNVLTVTKFRDLLRTMRENRPGDDLELVRRAYEFSQTHHAGQMRASGKPYLIHPLEVALVLADMKMDPVAIAAGLLHVEQGGRHLLVLGGGDGLAVTVDGKRVFAHRRRRNQDQQN